MTSSGLPLEAVIGIMVLGVVLLLFIAGITLFILGMVRRRRGLWIAGLALFLVVLTVFGLLVFGFWAFSDAPAMPTPTGQPATGVTAAASITTSRQLRDWFADATGGLQLPEDVTPISSDLHFYPTAGGPDIVSVQCVKASASESLEPILAEGFAKIAWEDARTYLGAGSDGLAASWGTRDVVGAEHYRRRGSDAPSMWTTYVAYDKAAGRAYILGLRMVGGEAPDPPGIDTSETAETPAPQERNE